MKSEKPPAPNLKNKTFVAWQRSESCKKAEDNLVSSDWHEKLKRMGRFTPVYDNKPVNMVYLMSGEYGRIWMRERDEWFKTSYIPQPRLQDLQNRQKKIRLAAKAAKKAAQLGALERKKRRQKEIEAKEKAKAEELEKLKEKVRKMAAPKLAPKTPKSKKKTATEPETSAAVEDETAEQKTCPKGWKQVELTLQCEGSGKKDNETNEEGKGEHKVPCPGKQAEEHKVPCPAKQAEEHKAPCPGKQAEEQKIHDAKEMEEQKVPAANEMEGSKEGCIMCDGFVQQMKKIHDKNLKEATEECERGEEAQ